jgi:hypothetical protein
MQYKLFSSNISFLPTPPSGLAATLVVQDNEFADVSVKLPSQYALLNGEEAVESHFNLNKNISALSNNPTLKATSDNYCHLQEDLKNLSLKSTAQQEVRMEIEAEEGRNSSLDAAEINIRVQQKLQNEFDKHSTSKEGYIFWIDGSLKHDRPIMDITPAPFDPKLTLANIKQIKENEQKRLKALSDVGSTNKNEGKVIKDRINRQIKKNRIYSGALEISKCATAMLRDVENCRVTVVADAIVDFQWFKSFQITTEEFEFYKARTTVEDVIRLAALEYEKVSDVKWELLPLVELSQVDRDRIQEKRYAVYIFIY